MQTYTLSTINEGGNVQIGDVAADRINLNLVSRDEIVPILYAGLSKINDSFKKSSGLLLWSQDLFKSKKFLSGSSLHFFDNAIRTSDFRSNKPTVGDIDTQVDVNMKDMLKSWLDSNPGKCGPLTFVGYKSSAGQYITLWNVDNRMNIQVDFELVDFENDRPTEWAQFSHSSSWEDLKHGIKGVFQKYALRALSTKSLRDIIVLTGKRKTPKKMTATDLAFSVINGLRYKLSPVMDALGKHTQQNGLFVYEEIPTKESTYYKQPSEIFKIFFGSEPSSTERAQFESFVGTCVLVKKYWSGADQKKFALGFANTLWGAGAQKLDRTSSEEDFSAKMAAYNHMNKALGIRKENSEIAKWRKDFYEKY